MRFASAKEHPVVTVLSFSRLPAAMILSRRQTVFPDSPVQYELVTGGLN